MAINSNIIQKGRDREGRERERKRERKKRKREERETTPRLDVPSPSEAIIAFGSYGENQILRGGNKWEKWEGRYCGLFAVSVRVNKNIFVIGGYRDELLHFASTTTFIFNIVTKTWSEGPKLNIARLA